MSEVFTPEPKPEIPDYLKDSPGGIVHATAKYHSPLYRMMRMLSHSHTNHRRPRVAKVSKGRKKTLTKSVNHVKRSHGNTTKSHAGKSRPIAARSIAQLQAGKR